MAIQVLGSDTSANGFWQIDYDNTAHTIGHTCTSSDPNARLTLRVTQIDTTTGDPLAGGLDVTKDVTADLNQGRVVDASNIPPSKVPVPTKGTIYPFTFAGFWTP